MTYTVRRIRFIDFIGGIMVDGITQIFIDDYTRQCLLAVRNSLNIGRFQFNEEDEELVITDYLESFGNEYTLEITVKPQRGSQVVKAQL